MQPSWVGDELRSVDLRDKRLEKRMLSLLETLSKASSASIPTACDDRAEMEAAYRFFDNDKVDFETVLAPHIVATYARVARQKVALLVQDTTELDLTRPTTAMEGAGPLQHGRRSGALLHLTHAFTTDGTPLGTVCAEAWTREKRPKKPARKKPAKRSASAKRVDTAKRPFEEKESVRWLQTAQHCVDVQSEIPDTQLVMLA
ncbi:transposase DNA-binding-containing protein, partial [bacterium]|nr:transposase DNA-binding-containing protein [bacterium]